MEATLIRPLYERHTYQIMLTFGLSFIGIELVRAIWGRQGFTMPRPPLFDGTGEGCPATSLADWLQYQCSTIQVTIGGETARIRTYNELFVPFVGLIVLVAVWFLLQRTRLGMIIRAGVQDSEMVEALGINVRQGLYPGLWPGRSHCRPGWRRLRAVQRPFYPYGRNVAAWCAGRPGHRRT